MTYYDAISEGYEELHKEEQLKKVKLIISKLELNPTDTLLDVGCGTGLYLYLFKCKVTGVDPAKKLIAKYKGKHRIILARAEELPFPNNSFDIVTSITTIHNFEDIEQGLREIKRVGRSRFVFSVLKRSSKLEQIERLIKELFGIDEIIEEDKDLIFVCHKKI
ncbi:MAG TPA: methyltransferase domain-containing protein [Candidatus Nanoarchaeia archaeon]|nr:methyltransferase domain-containing protein [Candidatus Nanoarchaeia archaeon]